MKTTRKIIPLLLAALIGLQLSCNYLLGQNKDLSVQSTLAALFAQQTALDETLAAFTAAAVELTTTPGFQSTLEANLSTATAQEALLSTLSSQPQASATPQPSPVQADDRLLKSAKILLFEDMSASRYIRIVKTALDQEKYFYQDVGSAKGWFKAQLNSPVEWDLVIAAAEAEREFGGEFFEYLDDQLEKGAAVILENWDLDLAPNGKAGQILQRCGVRHQSDWYEPELRAFFWLATEDPILNQPNAIPPALRNASRVWSGDLGDLLEVDPGLAGNGGNPTPLAGLNPSWKSSHATLVVCLDGQLIIQTFRTHEYQYDDMLLLWKNYVNNALSSHFARTARLIPTAARTAQPTPAGTSTPSGPTPGPEYIFEHGCDGLMSIKLTNSPRFQQDLFEHHAEGLFLILRVQIQNQADFPIMIWDGDYTVSGQVGEKAVVYPLDPDATGYLYIEGGGRLAQDVIQPGDTWNVSLAFNVDPQAQNLAFVFKPASEFDGAVCEASIPLDR